ncbi:leucine-rich PPR motif-containing protein, mitochondrial [Diabrotica undecimpunctata]|uniref:leucine-rich PPR motif-containing protein, mitochondrial n=1 Tax=Diabrotica undecimpunctata TaxID=50387 RepID=UPI003B63DA61
MASILRSSKFVRYIAGFARNVVINTPREFDGNFVNTSQCLCGVLPSNFATQASTLQDQNLETSLRRIDQDVRKSGRISRRDIEDVLEEIRQTRSATSSQSLLVIRCCGNLVPDELPEIRTKLVQEIWNTLNKLNVPMDISHYNALLRVYLENEHPFSPTEFLSELENKGIEPNRVTYQRLIARYCQDGDIEGATKILEFMREKQMSVNENVFNALIVGHSKAGDMDSAQGIINVMTQAGLEPSADSYTTLVSGYAAKGDIETILKLLEECESKEIFLLDKDYLDIVYALAVNGHKQHVPAILGKVRKAIAYNQDAVNITLRLINKGEEEAGFEVLKSMPRITREDGSPVPTGHFFIRQLVKANRPLNVLLKYCDIMEKEHMYDRAFLLAAEMSLQLGNEKLAYPLLEEVQKRGVTVRQHFFWPLLISKANDNKAIVDILQKMHDFNVFPNNETIREYVIPNLKGNSSEILALLRDGNISVGSAASSLVISLLLRNEIKEAATIATTIQAYYNPDMTKRALTNAFYKTNDLKSYIAILRTVFENVDRKKNAQKNEDDEEEVNEGVNKAELVGNFVLDLSSKSRAFVEKIESVLQALCEQGLSISTPTAEKIEDKLGEKMTDQISQLLGRLSSGELTPVPIQRQPPSYVPSHQMNIPQLERLIQNLTAKNQETKGLKRQLFTLYYRAKDLEKTEKLVQDLNQIDFVFTPGLYAQLFDLYAYHGNLEKALEYYNLVKEKQGSEFALDSSKILRFAHLYIKSGQFDECIKLLENTPQDKKDDDKGFSYTSLVWRLLNSLAEEGKVEELDTLFNTLVKKEFIEVSNVLLGPLIKVRLIKKDLESALEKFEWCVNHFKATPWKNELACQLIQNEDAEKLQKLTDLSTSIHGEVNSLYDLVFAFVECGRVRQARRILETPGLQVRPQRINTACERYQQEGLIKPLEGLKDATKDLNHIDRSDIYYQLLLSYIKQDDIDKALGLWTQMQEEDMAPSDQFLLKLGDFLQNKGRQVPFVVPQTTVQAAEVPQPTTPQVTPAPVLFRQKLKLGNVDEALKVKNNSKEALNVVDLTILIEKLLQQNRLKEASKVTFEILDRGNIPVNRVFRFLLNKLATAGDVDTLSKIGQKINSDVKRIVSFDNRMCHANLVAGNAEAYLKKLNNDIDIAKDEDLSLLSEQFPRGGAYGILEKHPDLTEQYEQLALKYAKRGIVGPLNVLWTRYFINQNHEKADQIWNEHLKDSNRIMFQKIVHTAREEQNENLAKKLIEHLKASSVSEGALGNAYSCLLDVLFSKENHKHVVETFEEAIKAVSLNFLNRTAIIRSKEAFEKLGKTFDYEIPPRNKNNVSIEDLS